MAPNLTPVWLSERGPPRPSSAAPGRFRPRDRLKASGPRCDEGLQPVDAGDVLAHSRGTSFDDGCLCADRDSEALGDRSELSSNELCDFRNAHRAAVDPEV